MTDAGLAKLDPSVANAPTDSPASRRSREGETEVPSFIEKALKAQPRAWENFGDLAPSYRRQYVAWIASAKREETRVRRLNEAVELLALNQKLGMK